MQIWQPCINVDSKCGQFISGRIPAAIGSSGVVPSLLPSFLSHTVQYVTHSMRQKAREEPGNEASCPYLMQCSSCMPGGASR